MPCTLVELTADNCAVSDGGIKVSYITDIDNIATITWDVNEQATAMTMVTPGQWTKFEYEDDDTAYYNQVGARTGRKHIFTQTAFLNFYGLSNDKRSAANALIGCCGLVAIHYHNNGTATIQGLQKSTDVGNFKETKKKMQVTASVLTDTGANSDRLELQLISESIVASHFTTLTRTAVEAL